MSGRYERVSTAAHHDFGVYDANESFLQVNAHDEEDIDSPVDARSHHPIPNSPPPSFHSRASSPARQNRVDPTLADAFDSDDESDDEADDRQRLVRQNSSNVVATTPAPATQPPVNPPPAASGSRPRVMGGGVADGVFANLSARPERANSDPEKEDHPPVRIPGNIVANLIAN